MTLEDAEQMMLHKAWLANGCALYDNQGIFALRAHVGEQLDGPQARDALTTLLAAFVEKSNRYRDELARMSPS